MKKSNVNTLLCLNEESRAELLLDMDAWDFHFWNGIKNDFPLCCIIWFVDCQTNKGLQEGSLFEEIYREAWESAKVKLPSIEGKYGRAMCPICLLNAFIKLTGDMK